MKSIDSCSTSSTMGPTRIEQMGIFRKTLSARTCFFELSETTLPKSFVDSNFNFQPSLTLTSSENESNNPLSSSSREELEDVVFSNSILPAWESNEIDHFSIVTAIFLKSPLIKSFLLRGSIFLTRSLGISNDLEPSIMLVLFET